MCFPARLSLLQQLRQLRDIRRNPPRLVAGYRWSLLMLSVSNLTYLVAATHQFRDAGHRRTLRIKLR
jgi:hypothetical protein